LLIINLIIILTSTSITCICTNY